VSEKRKYNMTDAVTVRADGRAEMAYRGETPWHGLGNTLDDNMTLEQRIVAAGFDWEILKTNTRYVVSQSGKPPRTMTVPGKQVLYRSDSSEPLSVVSSKFHIVQPRQVLEYFDELTEKFGFGKLETAGTLFGGKQFWGLATVTDTAQCILDDNDKVRMRILFCTSCDRSLPNIIKFVIERVVCHNTLEMALREGGVQYRSRHRTAFKPEEANAALGIKAKEEFGAELEQLRKLAKVTMTPAEIARATMTLYEPTVENLDAGELKAHAKTKHVKAISQLAIGHDAIGDSLKGAHGTLWGWLNAVTEYNDWDNGSRTADRRLHRAWNGKPAGVKRNALKMAVSMLDNGGTVLKNKLALSDDDIVSLVTAGE
jgi:phage/plasmid-like protein (TIGR03299 family)